METRVFKKNSRNTKLFKWASGISILMLLLSIVFYKSLDINMNTHILLLLYSILFGIQYIDSKSWYIKTDKEALYIKSFLFPKKVLYSEILEQRVIVTGDIKLKLEKKEIEISKDVLRHDDFEDLKEILNKLNP